MDTYINSVFTTDVAILVLLLIGALWSVVNPAKRIWPPPKKASWQFWLAWILFYLVFGLNLFLLVFEWNSWFFTNDSRFIVGVPLALIGALLVTWGIRTLGTINTSGIRDRFVTTGPYAFTRNPQYLGDIILFLGLSIIANSLHLWITHALLILVFVATPLAEEAWLEVQYGEAYDKYRIRVSRFL